MPKVISDDNAGDVEQGLLLEAIATFLSGKLFTFKINFDGPVIFF